jgi:hypothetical protein
MITGRGGTPVNLVVNPNPKGVKEYSVAPMGLIMSSTFAGVSPLPVA